MRHLPRRCRSCWRLRSTLRCRPARNEPHGFSARLTRRELDILRLVAQGRSNSQVAAILWVTEQTVKFHLANMYRKLGVSNRTEASHWAIAQGLVRPHD